MYISLNLENVITIGIVLVIWMLALHLLAQIGINAPAWLSGMTS